MISLLCIQVELREEWEVESKYLDWLIILLYLHYKYRECVHDEPHPCISKICYANVTHAISIVQTTLALGQTHKESSINCA